ncbi:MAG: hypothetical protein PHW31_00635 [Candidatus Pacebacteria bacterium]|nr:hypothetical protein [Candidatus Paceibacterota bacterium]
MSHHHFLQYNKRVNYRFIKNPKTVKSGAGFTLVEAIVAIGVVIIGLVAVLQVFPIGFSMEKYSQMETQAVLASQEKIEALLGESFSGLAIGTTVENSLSSPYELFSRTTKISFVDVNLNESANPTGLKKIEITVSWKSSLKIETKQTKLITLMAER